MVGQEASHHHQLAKGATSKSYGIQVARLAGVPKKCIELAKHKLTEYNQAQPAYQKELLQVSSPDKDPDQTWRDRYETLSGHIRSLDVDNLTPRAALDAMYQLAQEQEELEATQ